MTNPCASRTVAARGSAGQGEELRALRRLQREQPPSRYVFCAVPSLSQVRAAFSGALLEPRRGAASRSVDAAK
jgi:hypothetical protein